MAKATAAQKAQTVATAEAAYQAAVAARKATTPSTYERRMAVRAESRAWKGVVAARAL